MTPTRIPPYINCKTKNTLSSEDRGKTHLKLSLAYERKGTGFQSASKKSLPSKVEQGIEHFPLHGPQLHQGKSALLNVICFLEKVWTKSDSKSNKPTDKSQQQKKILRFS
jgi:hypothetical protein